MNIHSKLTSLLFASAVWNPAMAGDYTHRHHDSHVHGIAELNIAVEGQQLLIELKSPAANIMGFEHAPKDKQQHEIVEQAAMTLKQPKQIIKLPASAQCTLAYTDVESDLIDEPHKHAQHEEVEDSHSEFNVSYGFNCQNITQLTSMEVTLFSRFAHMEKIKVQLITPDIQRATTLSPSSTKIEF